jgi:hypothetical protein
MEPATNMLATRRPGLLVLLAALSAVVAPARGQQVPETRVITLEVHDRGGHFIEGIEPEQLRIKGVVATVRHLQLDSSPRRIILLLDVSSSMAGDPYSDRDRWQHALQMAKVFVSRLQPDDRVALHVFAKRHIALMEYTQDFGAVIRQIDALPKPGTKAAKSAYGYTTWLPDTLAEILATDKELGLGDAIVLISDAESFHAEKTQLWKLKPELAGRGIRVFLLCIALPWIRVLDRQHAVGSGTVAEYRAGMPWIDSWEELGDLVRNSGGSILDVWGPVVVPPGSGRLDLDPRFIESAAHIAYLSVRKIYEVELELSSPLGKPCKITLQMADVRSPRLKDLDLVYPHILIPAVQSRKP